MDGIAIWHGIAGRGGGKTIGGILLMLESCLIVNIGCPHLWTEPTYRDCLDTFLRTWMDIVPPELYTWHKADMIIRFPNGASIDVRSRDSKTGGKSDPFRGPSYAGIVHDEIAKDRGPNVWNLALATLRHPKAKQLWCVGITTPKKGWYEAEVLERDHPWIRWKSSDSPYLPDVIIEQWADAYSPDLARQELDAEWIPQTGRIWNNFKDAPYSEGGHRHDTAYDSSQGYILAGDLGIHSGWLIIQQYDGVDVVVAEYTPEEGTDETLKRIDADYGRPRRVVVGRDVNTRAFTDAKKPMLFVRNQWGGNVPVLVPHGDSSDKMWQYHVLSGRILNAKGQRRLCVSKKIKSHDKRRGHIDRGVMATLTNDCWPEAPKVGEYLPKDSRYEHIRDALLYFAICMYPPRFTKV